MMLAEAAATIWMGVEPFIPVIVGVAVILFLLVMTTLKHYCETIQELEQKVKDLKLARDTLEQELERMSDTMDLQGK